EGVARTAQETTQEKILALLKAKPTITRKELTAQIGISPDGVNLAKIKSARNIRHVGPAKGRYWEVLK
ncbi:MAG: winged helix-turn-helix transcriptional regulator, partial [Desulfobulbales bacterium]|nr:winged helix-turn-helix transcriptional regulator [Desulfobulbales bacterium]